MNMNFSDDLSVFSVKCAGGSRGQQSSPAALRMSVRMSESLKSFQPPGCQVWIIAHQTSLHTWSQLFGAQLKLMSLYVLLCVNERRGRLIRRCPSCITASHAWMIILPIKSRAGQQSSCSRFLNECTSSLAESLMPKQLPCQSDVTSQTYLGKWRFCCCTNNWAWLILDVVYWVRCLTC